MKVEVGLLTRNIVI